MPEKGEKEVLRIKVMTMGAAECGKVSLNMRERLRYNNSHHFFTFILVNRVVS